MIIKNATLQTLFPYWKIAIFRRIAPRKKNIASRPGGILGVDKIVHFITVL